MESYINVIGNGQKIVEVAAEPTGVINEETLRRAFLLEADVVIGLFRNDSRSHTPNWYRGVISFLLETDQGCCVSVMAKRAALTCAHCLDDNVSIGDNVEVKPCKGSILKNFPNGQTSTTLKVAYINKHDDFVFLLSKIDLCDDPPFPTDATFGENYVLIGLSAQDRQYTRMENLRIKMVDGPLCVKKGVISSKVMDKYNKHMGDSGMKKGDSGGGLYTLHGDFIGIAVEFNTKVKEGISMCHFNPVTYMLTKIQDEGYAWSDLNNFEENDYPRKKEFRPAEGRGH
ncbi:hypothetical protein FO519_009877 [Halicephalobus sp. NKZ332]|nr:hypothetical protein FO519_009877 [Halicephalobus sp. NKZ332]